MSIIPDRNDAIEATLSRIRGAGDDLDKVQAALSELARHQKLFPYEHFPIEPSN
jgi:hypothetical protein